MRDHGCDARRRLEALRSAGFGAALFPRRPRLESGEDDTPAGTRESKSTFGFTPDEFIGQPSSLIFTPEDRQQTAAPRAGYRYSRRAGSRRSLARP